jgi:hypothetical protein
MLKKHPASFSASCNGRRAAVLGSGGYRGFAIAALCQGLLAAGLALPLLHPSRAR